MPTTLQSATVATLFFSGHLMAQSAVIHFSGAVVEPTCQVGLSDVSASGARVSLSDCNRALYMQLNEPRSAMPSVSYRLTDVAGRPLGRSMAATGDADSVIRSIRKDASSVGSRNVVLVAEYL
ncbi:hypothetical protein ACQCLI_15155 [Pseudomonas nitroreducens]|uniref:hypothetical protein n=1 Tax=Pseudomonas TaxID=286 RepID=UPI0002E69FD8|nr:hypothetical protein [Pseudomonas nitroreducens]